METDSTKETEQVSAEEFKKLQEENAALKKQAEQLEKEANLEKYIDKRIEEAANKKLEEFANKEEQELEKARALLAKAQENERIARELDENRKYASTETGLANKRTEFINSMEQLNELIRQGKYMTDTFDLRKSKTNRTIASIAYAANTLGGERAGQLLMGKMGIKYNS